ncbi:MAG: 4a-hydroxytetrahydrobiopterin dehydratase [Acidobacteria bacterium]|nr:4a-hydroxytetrahydrobiopterin dehydratase [Acidobacteriota bacterium]
MSRHRLTEEQVLLSLVNSPLWERQNNELRRQFIFPSFREAMDFVNQVAELAEAADHHPDIIINWNKVTLSLTTHDRGGLTALDFDLAHQIDVIQP